MCEIIDFSVFHPKIAISTIKTIPIALAIVDIGATGSNIPKYPPRVLALDCTIGGNPVDPGNALMIPFIKK